MITFRLNMSQELTTPYGNMPTSAIRLGERHNMMAVNWEDFTFWLFALDYPHHEDNLKSITLRSGRWFQMDWSISQWNCPNSVNSKGLWKKSWKIVKTHLKYWLIACTLGQFPLDTFSLFQSHIICIFKCAIFLWWNITPWLDATLLDQFLVGLDFWRQCSQVAWYWKSVRVHSNSNWGEGGPFDPVACFIGFPPVL